MIGSLVLLAAVAAAACLWLGVVVRARNRRVLLSEARGLGCDRSETSGISVLCCGLRDVEQVAELLAAECACYEVVVVLDSRVRPAEFGTLAARYRMTRVAWRNAGEFPAAGIRAVARSRRRCFRRLVLVDRVRGSAAEELNAAAAAATYDYLLPVCRGELLLPDTVARLSAELGACGGKTPELIRSRLGMPAMLVSREAVASAGGFGPRLVRSIPRSRRRTLWEPLLCAPGGCRRQGIAPTVAAIAAAGAAAAAGWWPAAALCAAAAVVAGAAACASQLVAEMAGGREGRIFCLRRRGGRDVFRL